MPILVELAEQATGAELGEISRLVEGGRGALATWRGARLVSRTAEPLATGLPGSWSPPRAALDRITPR